MNKYKNNNNKKNDIKKPIRYNIITFVYGIKSFRCKRIKISSMAITITIQTECISLRKKVNNFLIA